jgi:RimJ/RimL family protein N-acetyltransferase
MNIAGRLVTLRAIEHRDLPQLHLWANDPDIQRRLGGWHFPTNENDQQKWWQAQHCQSTAQRFAIVDREDRLLGTAGLTDINWKDRNAFVGTLIGETTSRNRGIGTDVVNALMRYAFEELDLFRLDTTIIADNEASLHVYVRKCGWIEEGRQAGWYFRGGQRIDRVLLGMTAHRYRQQTVAA